MWKSQSDAWPRLSVLVGWCCCCCITTNVYVAFFFSGPQVMVVVVVVVLIKRERKGFLIKPQNNVQLAQLCTRIIKRRNARSIQPTHPSLHLICHFIIQIQHHNRPSVCVCVFIACRKFCSELAVYESER